MALFPYLLVIVVFSLSKLVARGEDLPRRRPTGRSSGPASTATSSAPPASRSRRRSTTSSGSSAPAPCCCICGIIVAIVYRLSPAKAAAGLRRDRWSSCARHPHRGERARPGLRHEPLRPDDHASAPGSPAPARSSRSSRPSSAGSAPPSPARTPAPNALFATLQQTAAPKAGIDPTLLVAANTSGGVVGKMISPQNLTIAATAVGAGRAGVGDPAPRCCRGASACCCSCACWCTCSPRRSSAGCCPEQPPRTAVTGAATHSGPTSVPQRTARRSSAPSTS